MTPIRHLVLAVAAIALAAVACAGAAGGSGSPSPMPAASTPVAAGIVGTATAGPVCPVETNPPDPSCAPRPVAGAVIVVRDASGGEVARATTGPDGTFAIAVAPGRYVVEALPVTGLMGTPAPQADVTVAPGAPTTVDFDYDTGIR
jgi:hypothetical protein